MQTTRLIVLMVISLVLASSHVVAQDKPSEMKNATSVLKVQVVITETEREKKLTNLPYVFFLRPDYPGPASPYTKIRIGSRIPVYTGKDGGMQYIDVGTNIDGRAKQEDLGRYDVILAVERSWVEGDVPVSTEKTSPSGDQGTGHFKEPIIRQFKTDLNLLMHDGQTVQTTQAADPLSGRVLSIAVTMTVVK